MSEVIFNDSLSREQIKDYHTLKIMLDNYSVMPERSHGTDAGLDLKTPIDFRIEPRAAYTVDTGVHVWIPAGYAGLLVSKSGLNVNRGITSTGLIDSGYTGQIKVKLYNHSNVAKQFLRGDKVSQLVLIPIWTPGKIKVVSSFDETERGDAGFGSTGR